jgi:ribosomal protein L11 methylase PrmA
MGWRTWSQTGGLLIMAGILDEQAEKVQRAAEQQGLHFVERRSSGDWVALVYHKSE